MVLYNQLFDENIKTFNDTDDVAFCCWILELCVNIFGNIRMYTWIDITYVTVNISKSSFLSQRIVNKKLEVGFAWNF